MAPPATHVAVEVAQTEPVGATPPARPYQETGRSFLTEIERGILGDDPGLGKSRVALEAAEGRVQISAPSSLYGTWQDEIQLWRPDMVEGVDWQFAPYTKIARRGPDSKGRMSKVEPYPRPEFKGPWDTLIADECHYLKGRNTTSTEAYEKIKSDRLYLLTGTPVPNWAHEIYMLLKLTRPPGVDINSYWRWVQQWFKVAPNRFNATARDVAGLKACKKACNLRPPDDPCDHWVEFILANRLDLVMLRRTREECLPDLPELIEHPPVMCPMSPAQEKVYRELKKDYITWAEGAGEISAWSAGELHSMLALITTGLETYDLDLKGSGKLDRLQADMEERRHLQTLVGVAFRNTAVAAQERLKKQGIRAEVIMGGIKQAEIDDMRREFQKGGITCLIGTYEKISEGMTLTAADTAIMVERSWKPSRNQQFIRRIHRLGQTKVCNLIVYITPHSLDDNMTRKLTAKTDEQMRFMKAREFAAILREAA